MEISYVIPTLNSSRTLESTLLGLSYQKDIRVFVKVVDSGSEDETIALCKKWGVEVLYADPGNMYHAVNVGLRSCKTNWIGYINSDDWLYPNSLHQLLHKAESDAADFIYGNCDFSDSAGRFMYTLSAAKPTSLLNIFRIGGLGFTQQATIFRRQCYTSLDGFNEDFQLAGDKEFFSRALLANFRFSHLSGSPVACFRLHSNQLSQKKFSEMSIESGKIRDSLIGQPTLRDQIVFRTWQISNIHNYLSRIIRQSALAGKLVVRRSMLSDLS